jgi:hypothetical protein
MPLDAVPTTIAQLQDVFRAAIEAMTPRTVRGQGPNGWRFLVGQRDPSQGARWFRFEWTNDGVTPGGFMWRGGASVDVFCDIITDYGGIPAHERDAIAHDDHQQLWDVLDTLRITTSGLCRVRSETWGEEATDRPTAHQIQIVHRFRVTYLQARVS